MNGFGGIIDKKGNAEMQSLKLRGFLEVPELRYNRVEISMGDTWYAPSAGIIESVDTTAQTITLKLEEGEIGSPRVGDICMGIFHNLNTSENATADYDDGRGNRRFAGFATCYFRITEELDTATYKTFKYQLRPVSGAYPTQYHPAASMTFVGYGSFSNEDRQTSRYETRTYQRYLTGVSDWEFTASNIAAQYGDLSNLSIFGIEMRGYSAYLNNIYMSGVIQQFTPGGEEVPTIIDRGVWSATETYNRNDDVYWNNGHWRCLVDGTKTEPGKDAEERGQGEAIARNLMEMSGLTVPVIAVVTGEGSSGGALALGVANHILMLENAVYSVLSPEGFASILWKDASRSGEACEMMKLTAQDLYSDGIVEQVIPEPLGGAQRSHAALFEQLDVALRVHLKELCRMSGRQLADQRYKKYRQIGETRNA